MFYRSLSKLTFITFLFMFCLCVAASAAAATFTVTRTDDRNMTCASGTDCSLREAVNAANTAAGNDTIDFDGSVSAVQLAAALPNITTTITILGGSGVTVSGDAGNFTFRAFTITSTGNLSLDNLTVTNAQEILGGGLHNQTGGTVDLTNCNFSSNTATLTAGGAIFNDGLMTVTNTVVGFNSAIGTGDGIQNGTNGDLTLTDCTVFFNGNSMQLSNGGGGIGNAGMLTVNRSTIYGNLTGGHGGGIFNNAGTLFLINSTVSFNSAFANNGGGVFNFGTSTITNSTITDQNTATDGGGVYNFSGDVNLRNSIVAGNNAPTGPDVSGIFATPMYNLIGKSDGSFSFTHGVNGNIVGTIAVPVDPLLEPIDNNGGPTQTYELMPGSQAANNGNYLLAVDSNNQPLTTDQRGPGFPRVIAMRVDIGSFESAFVPTAAAFSIVGRVKTAEGSAISGARLVMTASSGETRTAISYRSGYYRFENVPSGEIYVISVEYKRFVFTPQVVTVTDDIENLTFSAQP